MRKLIILILVLFTFFSCYNEKPNSIGFDLVLNGRVYGSYVIETDVEITDENKDEILEVVSSYLNKTWEEISLICGPLPSMVVADTFMENIEGATLVYNDTYLIIRFNNGGSIFGRSSSSGGSSSGYNMTGHALGGALGGVSGASVGGVLGGLL